MERLVQILLAPLGFVWALASPVTYILAVVHTWQTKASVVWKLFINVTLDALMAAFWPITWFLWGIQHSLGQDTPIRLLFG